MPRAQQDEGRHVRRLYQPPLAGRDHPYAYAEGGDRRTRICGWRTRPQGHHDGELCAPADQGCDADIARSGPLQLLDRYLRTRQRVQLRPGMGEMPRTQSVTDLPFRWLRMG